MQYSVSYGSAEQKRYAGSFLFVLSHMRSFSSLLCHILGSHAEISGYAEAHLSYFSRNDLDRLARKLRDLTEEPTLGRYALDKLLHSNRQIGPEVLARPDVKVLILLRRPEDTMRSILNMSHARGEQGRYKDFDAVLAHYLDRLHALEMYSGQLGRKALYLPAENLIEDTEGVLESMSRWLELAEPLSPNYKTFKFTGEADYGDPSSNIKTGKIVRDAEERHRTYIAIPMPEEGLRRAEIAYRACVDILVSRCSSAQDV